MCQYFKLINNARDDKACNDYQTISTLGMRQCTSTKSMHVQQ